MLHLRFILHSPFSILNYLEDFFQCCNQLIHLLIRADGDTQVIINARQLEIADKDTLFAQGGEAAFRRMETQALEELGKRSGCVIATGGGCVTRAENYPLLHQNSVIVWLQRDTARLPSKGRPLSQNADLAAMYAVRAPLYARFSDYSADNNRSPEETVRHIMEVLS